MSQDASAVNVKNNRTMPFHNIVHCKPKSWFHSLCYGNRNGDRAGRAGRAGRGRGGCAHNRSLQFRSNNNHFNHGKYKTTRKTSTTTIVVNAKVIKVVMSLNGSLRTGGRAFQSNSQSQKVPYSQNFYAVHVHYIVMDQTCVSIISRSVAEKTSLFHYIRSLRGFTAASGIVELPKELAILVP